jgi:hypothetical protein
MLIAVSQAVGIERPDDFLNVLRMTDLVAAPDEALVHYPNI